MTTQPHAQTLSYRDAWLVGGASTPFADYNGALRDVSATDLGIKAGREALKATFSHRGGSGWTRVAILIENPNAAA